MIDISTYKSLETAILVKWEVPNFATAYLSDYNSPITYAGNTYLNIGNLLSISGYVDSLKASTSQLSIGLSGLPTGSISTILDQQVRGSKIEIYRALFDPANHTLIGAISPNPMLKYKGIVTGYDVSDSMSVSDLLTVATITLVCMSPVEILNKKISGRRTNPADFKTESSMNRVPALANSNFNFGAPGDAQTSISVSMVGVNK